MLIRIISALVGAPLIIFFLIVKGNYLYLFAGILSMVGLYEYYKAIKATGTRTMNFAGYAFTLVFYLLQFLYPEASLFGQVAAIMLLFLFTYEIFTRKYGVNGILHTLFGVIYVSFLLFHVIAISNLKDGAILLWLPFLCAWFTDSAAYFTGVSIGKHKLCPAISPKKTVEGAIGGILGCSLLIALFGLFVGRYEHSIPFIHFIAIGILGGLASEIGDLAASYIKRFTGIKDFGNLIPGHGGILDRFDSILFTAPVVYSYFLLIQNI